MSGRGSTLWLVDAGKVSSVQKFDTQFMRALFKLGYDSGARGFRGYLPGE